MKKDDTAIANIQETMHVTVAKATGTALNSINIITGNNEVGGYNDTAGEDCCSKSSDRVNPASLQVDALLSLPLLSVSAYCNTYAIL